MNLLMIIALVAIGVAGLAAVLGIWVERDPRRPKIFAYAISVVIVMATGMTVLQTYMEQLDSEKKTAEDLAAKEKLQNDLARMMQTLDKMASESEDPQLLAFLSTELEAQARSNPDVINKLAQRVEDEGGSATKMLGKHMSSSEVEKIARKGALKTKPKETVKKSENSNEEPKKPSLPAHLKSDRNKKPAMPFPGMIKKDGEDDGEDNPAGNDRSGDNEEPDEEADEEKPPVIDPFGMLKKTDEKPEKTDGPRPGTKGAKVQKKGSKILKKASAKDPR